MKILWLTSWYPDKLQPFNGDFIQRHARSAALYNDVHVIHVAGYSKKNISIEKENEIFQSGRLSEQIIYFRKSTSLSGKIVAHFQWKRIFKNAIERYIEKNGKPDLVHVQIPVKAGLLALWMKKKFGLPFFVTEHWGIYNDVLPGNFSKRNFLFKRITNKIFKGSAKFISVSRFLAEGVNRMVIKKDFVIIPNVVDTKLFYRLPREKNKFRFIHVSNMVPLKNVEGILRAFKNLHSDKTNVELIMVGDTDAAIRDYASQLGLLDKTVSFRGEVSYEQVAKEMQECDCLILFSIMENSPCVIGEALCCGLPVIATNVGGIPELIDESNSILINSKDEQALTAAMQQMINNHSAYDRKKIAEAAENKFSYSIVGKQLDEIYRSDLSLI